MSDERRKKQGPAPRSDPSHSDPKRIPGTPGTENDGGESALAGRSREFQPGVPEEVENPNRQRPSSAQPPDSAPRSNPQENPVDEALEESFPASDPPSYMGNPESSKKKS